MEYLDVNCDSFNILNLTMLWCSSGFVVVCAVSSVFFMTKSGIHICFQSFDLTRFSFCCRFLYLKRIPLVFEAIDEYGIDKNLVNIWHAVIRQTISQIRKASHIYELFPTNMYFLNLIHYAFTYTSRSSVHCTIVWNCRWKVDVTTSIFSRFCR